MTDVFEEALRKVVKSPAMDPFTTFGLKSFDDKNIQELGEFFENYKAEIDQLLAYILSIEPEKPTVKIAIIGPSGSGKTTLMRYLLLRLGEARADPKYEETLKKIGLIMGFYAKGAPTEQLDQQYDALKRNKGGVVTIDDIHEIFIKNDQDNREKELIKRYYDILTSSTYNNVIITTWLPYGWLFATSKFPELKNVFEHVVFVEGLPTENCRKMIDKRFKYCSKLNEYSDKIKYDPFIPEAIERIIEISSPTVETSSPAPVIKTNPGMVIRLLNRAVVLAYESNLQQITKREVDLAADEFGWQLIRTKAYERLSYTRKNLIKAALAATSMLTREVAFLAKKWHSNTSSYMSLLTRLNFFMKKTVDNMTIYTMSPLLRYHLERDLMKEVEISLQKK